MGRWEGVTSNGGFAFDVRVRRLGRLPVTREGGEGGRIDVRAIKKCRRGG
jgi:hypothetical protein